MRTSDCRDESRITANDREFRRARARLGAFALHNKHPSLAKAAGRKGGEATSSKFSGGKRAWGLAMAMKRWHKTPFTYESRAPMAGPGADGGGTPEPDPAAAPNKERRPRRSGAVPEQGRLL